MRYCFFFAVIAACTASGFAQDTPAAATVSPAPAATVTVMDPVLRRAQEEVEKVRGLVGSGVLPRARLADAEAHLLDMQDDAAIRNSLYQKDITVEQADSMVELTARRVARRQAATEERFKLLSQGIIAQSELTDAVSQLDQAKREHTWAETRARLARELVDLAKNEQEIMHQMELSASAHASPGGGLLQHFVGSNRFDMTQFASIDRAFEGRFAHALPVSAMGETEVHRSLGFDHRNRVDVALQPELPEGVWLRNYLTAHNIPFFAFKSAVAHKATGAHIHIGPPSLHYIAQAHPHSVTGGTN
jgi:hypothetical protein